jgi:hypothetical protein
MPRILATDQSNDGREFPLDVNNAARRRPTSIRFILHGRNTELEAYDFTSGKDWSTWVEVTVSASDFTS